MNSALKAARQRFRGQKATMDAGGGGYDDSPYTNGTTVAKIVESKVKEVTRGGEQAPVHYIMLEIADGPDKGRKAWTFPPRLEIRLAEVYGGLSIFHL